MTLQTLDLASPEAGRIALKGGAADVVVSDWLWVSRERSLGGSLKYAPFSSTVGSLMAPPGSPIRSLSDLRGRRIGIAGGALNANWLILRALARRDGFDLAREAQPVFGAAPLLFEKALQRDMDATLTFWNFAARLEAAGFSEVFSVEDASRALGVDGAVSNLGYIFDERVLATNGDALRGFLAASREAKEILARSDEEWEALRPLVMAPDEATFLAYRRRFREGIPRRPVAEEEADARRLYRILAAVGGRELVGDAAELDPGTWYAGP